MSRRAYLFLEADRRVFRCQFTKDLTIIGSAPDADIIIKDPSVLGHHAQIARTGDSYTLRRIDRSEVRVDGERVDGGHDLTSGERVGVGDTDILFVREQPESATTVRLLVERPGEPTLGFWTAKSTITVGRERGDIIIDDPLLSRVHCIIENYCEGGQYLLDARSERGTALNGIAIDTRYRLVEGDVISVGGVKLVFQAGAPGAALPTSGAALAAARVSAARARGVDPELSARGDGASPVGRDSAAVPRNPYQRYPSSLQAGAPRSDADAPIRRASVDLKSGVSTGIVDPAAARIARERARAKDARGGADGSAHAEPAHREPARAEPLPTFKPRPGWGSSPEQPARSFGDDVSTRISHVGETLEKGEGLWYHPRDARAGSGGAPPIARPIIRPRGDVVPSPSYHDDDHESDVTPPPAPVARPLIKRPDPSGLKPMSAHAPARPYEPPPPPEPVIRRTSDGARNEDFRSDLRSRPPEPQPAARPSGGGGGARGDGRWYLPESGARAAPRRAGDPSYYVPEARRDAGHDDSDDKLKREFRRPKFGGKTQGFDPSDY